MLRRHIIGSSFTFACTMLLVPALVFAAPQTFTDLVNRIVSIVNLAIPILISLAIVLFMYNILGSFGLFGGEGNALDKEKFRSAALWGVVIIFVLVSIWGILEVLRNTFLSSDTGSFQTTTETSFQ